MRSSSNSGARMKLCDGFHECMNLQLPLNKRSSLLRNIYEHPMAKVVVPMRYLFTFMVVEHHWGVGKYGWSWLVSNSLVTDIVQVEKENWRLKKKMSQSPFTLPHGRRLWFELLRVWKGHIMFPVVKKMVFKPLDHPWRKFTLYI